MEDVEDEGDSLPRNVAPSDPSSLLELSDGSENEDSKLDDSDNEAPASEPIEIDDEVEEPEESAEAELGQYCYNTFIL